MTRRVCKPGDATALYCVEITGSIRSTPFQRARLTAEAFNKEILRNNPDALDLKVHGVTDFEFPERLAKLKKSYPDLKDTNYQSVYFLFSRFDSKQRAGRDAPLPELWSLTQFSAWTRENYSFDPSATATDAENEEIQKLADVEFGSFFEGSARNPLDEQQLSFVGTEVNRLVPEGWMQAGEFETDDGPLMGEPLPVMTIAETFPCNFSQFMVTFRPMPYFNRKFVCVGRCVDGADVLDRLEGIETRFEKPLEKIVYLIGKALAVMEALYGVASLEDHPDDDAPSKRSGW
ncbi:hypothetical protein DFJ73DRAFT_762656 [Zopfochytrium polystomum]|nr:hypothetical protein DFJ73DRAFT_762656 [Zopfochytrium polystomum]